MGLMKKTSDGQCERNRYCKINFKWFMVLSVIVSLGMLFCFLRKYNIHLEGRSVSSHRRPTQYYLKTPSIDVVRDNLPNWTEWTGKNTIGEVTKAVYDYIEHPRARCERSVSIGGAADYRSRHFDGHKWVCLDPAFGLLHTNSCLVYSFGINNEWSFDDNMELLQCEVYAFDPSMRTTNHTRSRLIHFFTLGVGSVTQSARLNNKNWEMRTYGDLVRRMGHENRTVHYLKIDIESSEWPMLEQTLSHSPQLLKNVRQIGMEIHLVWKGPDKPHDINTWKRYLNVFMRMERLGFRLFHSEVNPYEPPQRLFPWLPRLVSRVYEIVWLNQG